MSAALEVRFHGGERGEGAVADPFLVVGPDDLNLLGNKRVKYAGVDMGALECFEGLAFTLIVR